METLPARGRGGGAGAAHSLGSRSVVNRLPPAPADAAAASPRTGSNTNVRFAAPPCLAVSQSTGSGFGSSGVPDDAPAAKRDVAAHAAVPRRGLDGTSSPFTSSTAATTRRPSVALPIYRGIEGDTRSTCILSGRRPIESHRKIYRRGGRHPRARSRWAPYFYWFLMMTTSTSVGWFSATPQLYERSRTRCLPCSHRRRSFRVAASY